MNKKNVFAILVGAIAGAYIMHDRNALYKQALRTGRLFGRMELMMGRLERQMDDLEQVVDDIYSDDVGEN